ncbi:MAG TPA: biopolymer transporter ExbD [Gammaproteobacteria bacterium]|nr:biopolymer transporter ExbD [Gammaproteobacteria bacterium]
MEQHYKRKKKGLIALNMVSLMDIFTILVFFLLVNSSEVEVVPSTKAIKLPESAAEAKPRETVAIVVNNKDLLVQGKRVAEVPRIMRDGRQGVIPALLKELQFHAKRAARIHRDPKKRGKITIAGDRDIPYVLLKRIMLTCSQAGFPDIALAVVQRSNTAGGAQ